jgi:PAS domain S-box-containing protein
MPENLSARLSRVPLFVRRLALIVLVAALYAGTAALGFRIALPPGNVTAFWPPSGIALAAVLAFGWQMGLGVFAGSLLINWVSLSGPAALPVAALIASASALQSWLMAWLIRRWVRPFPPETVRKTIVATLIPAVLTVIAALVGVTSLCTAGYAPWHNFTTLVSVWWLGDAVGVLLFAPSLLLLLDRARARATRQALLWPLTGVFIGLSLLAYLVIQNSEQMQLSKEIRHDLNEKVYLLQAKLDQQTYVLEGMRAVYASFGGFTPTNFQDFTRPLINTSPALTAAEWIPLVKAADRTAFEQAVRARGTPDFFIFEKDPAGKVVPAGPRGETFPVTLIEPFARNQAAFGYDLGSDPQRLQTINAARDSGTAAASPPVALVQETSHPVAPATSILMLQAVYQAGKPLQTVAERRASLVGFTVVIFRVKDLLSDALASSSRQDLEVYLYDIQDGSEPRFMAFFPSLSGPQSLPANPPRPMNLYSSGTQSDTLTVGGRTWLVLVRPGADYAAGKTGSVSWVVLGTGLLLAGLFLGYEHSRITSQAVLAQSEARYRLISENSSDVIWILDVQTQAFKYVSPSVERMIGFTPAEVLNFHLDSILTPAAFAQAAAVIPVRLTAFLQNPANNVFTDELDQVHKDGSIVHGEISTTYAADESGQVQIIGITRDINERRRAQAAVQESLGKLNAALASMTDAVVIVDRAGQITHTNAAYATYHRFANLEEFSRAFDQTPRLIEVLEDSGAPLPLDQWPMARAMRGEAEVNAEFNLRRTDTGETWTGAYSFAPILDASGAINGAVAVARDVTEMKQAAQLQEMVYRIAEAAQAAESLEAFYAQVHAELSRVMYAEVFYIALYEEPRDLLRFVYAVDQVNPPDGNPFTPGKGLTEKVLRTGRSLLCDADCMESLIAGGELVRLGKPCQAWLGAPLITHGKTIGVLAILHYTDAHIFKDRDRLILEYVSSQVATTIERKQAADLLEKHRANLEAAQSIAHLGSWELEPGSGRGLSWSREMFELFHCDPAAGVPPLETFMEMVHPDDRQPLLAAQQRAFQTGQLVSQDYRAFPGGGPLRYFIANLQAAVGENGALLSMSGTVLDVTEHRLMEENIKERVKELTCLFRVSQILENRQQTTASACQFILAALIPAMQFPHLAAPVLELDGKRYGAAHSPDLLGGLHAAITTDGSLRGRLSVFYTKLEAFSLPEEQHLLDNTAHMLSLWLEQRESEAAVQQAQRDLEELNRTLEQRVEERTAEVRQSEATYRALFDNSNDGIFLIAPDGSYITANQRGLDSLGYTLEEFMAVAQTAKNAVADPAQKAEADLYLAAALRGEFVPLYERTFISKDGKRGQVEVNLSPVRDPSGRVILVQSVVRDITERKKAEEALRYSRDRLSAANAALEKASRLKDEFLASMSHELRTPLTGILGLSEALQLNTYGSLTEKQLKAVQNIESSGRHLLELINDILDLSKIEAGKLEMQFEPCSLGEICQAALQLTKGMAAQKQIQVAFAMEPARIVVRADPRRVKQMLVNLISNAIKFTPAGGKAGLEVSASWEEQAVSLSVWDNGIGIKPEEMQKLFKPFSQIDSSLARQFSGTGLGLSLVKKMAEMHGGSVTVESTFGAGSRFTIRLPWAAASLAAETSPYGSSAVERSTLTIEDNFLDAEHITRYLQEMGFSNVVQAAAAGALEHAARLRPSAILLDLRLSDGDGMRLLSAFKADHRTRAIPVIIVSVEERVSEAYQAGAAGYLVKPFSKQDLRGQLAKAAVFQNEAETVLVVSTPQPAAAPSPDLPRPAGPLIMQADDNESNLEMIGDYLEAQGLRVISTRSGYELLAQAPELHPDLMLVDIQMPNLDGMETIRRLRAHPDPRVANAPIIAVTALAMTGDRERCLAAGANEYLSKPVSLRRLVQLIRELLAAAG